MQQACTQPHPNVRQAAVLLLVAFFTALALPAGSVSAAGPVSASASTVTASPTSVVANGTATATITVTLRDAQNIPVSGKTVTLSSSRGSVDTITTTQGTSDGSGVATFTVSSNTAGTSTYTAADTTDSIVVDNKATVTFTGVGGTASTVIASPTSVPADGTATSTITVSLRDANGNPIGGKNVVLSSSRGSLDTITPAAATADTGGVASFTVKSSSVGTATITATDTTDNVVLNQKATVAFTSPGPVDIAESTVTAAPTVVPADGTATATITVTLKDASGNPVADKTVTLASSRGSDDIISAASGVSDANGVVTFSVKSRVGGTAKFTATDTTDGLTLTQQASVMFVAPGSRAAPVPVSPACGSNLANLGPLLTWTQEPGAQWFQIQVTPAKNDGPGINLIISDAAQVRAAQYQVQQPDFGGTNPNYVMLPDMTYTWHVRTAITSGTPAEADWTAWSVDCTFHSATKGSATITLLSPTVAGTTPTLSWSNSDAAVFYYEVQVSRDANFGAGAGSPMLYWELRHGGVTTPPDSYTIPSAFPLQNGQTYYWRVRPRVQGDGMPVAWTAAGSFHVP